VPDDRRESLEVVPSGLRHHGDDVPITEGDLMATSAVTGLTLAGHDARTSPQRRRGLCDCCGPSTISDAPHGAHT